MPDGQNAPDRPDGCPRAVSVLDFTDKDPFGFYADLSAGGPAPVWDETAGAWLVHDFQQCLDCERNENRFANMYRDADPITVAIKGGGANITLSQGPDHLKLRRFHFRLLSAANVERFRTGHVRPIINGLLDRFPTSDRVDLAADYAAQIPPRVICALLGMPTDDGTVTEIRDANEAIVRFIASGYRDTNLRDLALSASQRLNDLLLPHVRSRRDHPADDFISRVWQEAPADGIAPLSRGRPVEEPPHAPLGAGVAKAHQVGGQGGRHLTGRVSEPGRGVRAADPAGTAPLEAGEFHTGHGFGRGPANDLGLHPEHVARKEEGQDLPTAVLAVHLQAHAALIHAIEGRDRLTFVVDDPPLRRRQTPVLHALEVVSQTIHRRLRRRFRKG